MIADKFVDLYSRNSGLRDKLVAERDIVLTYALRALLDAGVMDHLAFKGGTCLRKLVFGSSGRFSEDLDFTFDSDRSDDDVLMELVEVFNGEHHGISFTFGEYYRTNDETSFGGEILYDHSWNDAGRFRLQVSLRERPTLPVVPRPMKPQAYFSHLEFDLFDVRSLQGIEMMAEKVRAAGVNPGLFGGALVVAGANLINESAGPDEAVRLLEGLNGPLTSHWERRQGNVTPILLAGEHGFF